VTAQDAFDQLGESVVVYLDAGEAPGGVASTIVDATGDRLRLVRAGALSLERLREVTPVDGPEPSAPTAADADPPVAAPEGSTA
jgi:tRNA A37 threonylcarbamoyladenosine synthetase subunit TsaC/SUA5/YrdC